jgi:hypothetical protein
LRPVRIDNDKKHYTGTFLFGASAKSAADKPAAPSSLFGSFAPAATAAAEPPKPMFGGFAFAKKSEADAGDKATSAVGGTKTAAETGGDLFAMFKPKAGESLQSIFCCCMIE